MPIHSNHGQPRNPRRASGFTLIELMVVIAILLILAVVVLAVGSNVKQRAQINKTKTTLTALQGILDDYERDTTVSYNIVNKDSTAYVASFLAYPKTKDAITRLITPGSNVVNDGFGRPIQIVNTPKRGFMSLGSSGNGGGDAIYSWDAQ